MRVELLRKLSQRSIAPDGGKCHLRLESHCVVPAAPLVIVSLIRRPILPAGRNSTYRPVQICGACSVLVLSVLSRLASEISIPPNSAF